MKYSAVWLALVVLVLVACVTRPTPSTSDTVSVASEDTEAGDAQTASVAPDSEADDAQTASAVPDNGAGDDQTAPVAPDGEAGDAQSASAAPDSEAGDAQSASAAPDSEAGDDQTASAAADSEAGDAQSASAAPDSEAGDAQSASAAADSEAGDAQSASAAADSEARNAQTASAAADSEAGDAQTAPAAADSEDGDTQTNQQSTSGRTSVADESESPAQADTPAGAEPLAVPPGETSASDEPSAEDLTKEEPVALKVAPKIEDVRVSSLRVSVGEMVSIDIEATGADKTGILTSGRLVSTQAVVFYSFGRKEITVQARNSAGVDEATVVVIVEGPFSVDLASSEVAHDARGLPATTGTIIGLGSYDEVRAEIDGEFVAGATAAEEYGVPVPFVGTQEIEIALFESGEQVTAPTRITITGTNQAPTKPRIAGPALTSATVGETLTFTIEASDPNHDPLRFEARPLPAGAAIDPNLGVFSWTPTAQQTGFHLINFYVYDVPYDSRRSFTQRTIIVGR